MDSVTPSAFAEVFRDVVRAFQPARLDRDALTVYHATLREFPLDVLRESARSLCRSQQFFPTTGEWYRVARQLANARAHQRDLASCARCGDRGLIRINYLHGLVSRESEPFDVAICDCRAGQWYRRAGAEAVRRQLQLTPANQVALIEDVDDEYRYDTVPQSGPR